MSAVATYAEFQLPLVHAIERVLQRARTPGPRIARHWVSTETLTWFGGAADHHQVHLSWSFGRLKDLPESPQRHTVGVFALAQSTFPDIDEKLLRGHLEAMVPREADGATRVFLMRVAQQFALADALLRIEATHGFEVSLFARPDAVDTPAPTSRWPEHARERVAEALAQMDAGFRARCERVWSSPEGELLAASRTH